MLDPSYPRRAIDRRTHIIHASSFIKVGPYAEQEELACGIRLRPESLGMRGENDIVSCLWCLSGMRYRL